MQKNNNWLTKLKSLKPKSYFDWFLEVIKLIGAYIPAVVILIITIVLYNRMGGLNEELKNNNTLVLGLLGLLVFSTDVARKNNIARRELKFKQDIYEDQKRETDMFLEKMLESSKDIAFNVSSNLKKDTTWVTGVLDKMGLRNHTLFSQRFDYYQKEKEFLAEQFAPLILKRCKQLIGNSKDTTVYLVIDSGTTLYPMFEKLAETAFSLYASGGDWLNKVCIITNNLPGTLLLMEKGRVNPGRHSDRLIMGCRLLPGVPLPLYSAVAGNETVEYMEKIRKEKGDNCIFIGILTGNWIRIRRSPPHGPVPLARGIEHLNFKQVLIRNCEETYVVAPLGKIMHSMEPDKINEILGYLKSDVDPDKTPYYEVNIDDEKAKTVKLVSTNRDSGRLLYEHSCFIRAFLSDRNSEDYEGFEDEDKFITSKAVEVPHLIFKYDELPYGRDQEIATEFPVERIRKRVMRDVFRIKR